MKKCFRWIALSVQWRMVLACYLLTSFSAVLLLAQPKTENVFLITIDGLRWQELFTGADSSLMNEKRGGVQTVERLEERFWRETAQERREALMPFFWKELMKNGLVYGNRNLGSEVMLTNEYRVSLPGYAELLAGFAQKEIVNNDPKQIQATTILEFVQKELRLDKDKVAVFASWDRFPYAVSKESGAIYCNAAYTAVVDEKLTERQRFLNKLQEEALSPWNGVRLDAFTFYHGMEYVKKHKPRLFYFAYDETDDWAHSGRYDRVLEAAHRVDMYLKELWQWVQSASQYRDKTSFVIATDHGRGSSDTDAWKSHGKKVEGAEYVWVAMAGPDTPKLGELSNTGTVYQKDIAPTIAQLLGLDFKKIAPDCGAPLPLAIKR